MKIISPLVSSMSGSVAGLTGSRNRGGLYFRARAVPTNPQSAFQTAVRNAVTTIVGRWNSVLTQAQRDAWDVYALNVTVTDTLGQSRNLSGQQHFVRSNVPRIQTGFAVVDDAPTVFDLGDYTLPSIGAGALGQEIELTFDNSDAWANEDDAAMLLYASREQNPGIGFFKGPYRFADSVDGDATTPPTSPATITPPFPITADNRIFAQVRVIRADGRLSGLSRMTAIVA